MSMIVVETKINGYALQSIPVFLYGKSECYIMKKRKRIIVGVLIGQLFCAHILRAEMTFEPSKVVVDERVDKVIVTGTRIANYAYELTGDMTVIDAEQISASGAHSVADVLEQVAGVNVYDRSTPKTSIVDIRGFGDASVSNVLILVNDRKLNSVDLSGPDLIQIPIEAVERIEILRGAGSVLYGDNAVAGVINIITKKGSGDLAIEWTNQYGSYDRYKSSGQISGQVDALGYYAYMSYDDYKGYRDRSDVLARNFNSRFTYEWGDRVDVDIEIGGHNDSTKLPGGLDEAELVGFGRRGAADTNFSKTEDFFTRLGVDIAIGPEAGQWGSFVFDLTYKDRDVLDSFFGTFNSNRTIKQWGLLSKYVFDHELFGKDIDFVLGFDLYDTDNDILGSGTNSDDITISKSEIGFYGFLEFETLDNLYLNLGSRYQEAEYDFDDRGSSEFTSQNPDEWSSLVGMKYMLAPGSNIFLNYQKTFRFLATDEWYSTFSGLNTTLKQQTGEQFEFGIKYSLNEWAEGSVTPYRMDITDEIYFDPSTFVNDNYEQTRRDGIEYALNLNLLEFIDSKSVNKLDLRLAYAYQDPEFRGGVSDGNVIPLVPKHLFTQQIVLKCWDNFLFSLQGRHVGDRVIGNDLDNNKAKARDYYIADARFAYQQKNVEIFIELNNLFDTKYNTYEIEKTVIANTGITRDVYPAEEFNMNFGVKVKF
ncbi:MAG: iron complex outermembrane receptor protein [Candidatus Omnitrophota bacterium]|jgi:iron complex outermembrane receptor protein